MENEKSPYKSIATLVLSYAFIVLTGGIIGYIKSKSFPSLISGVGFGMALLISSYFIFHQKRKGLIAAFIFIALLTATFLYRYWLSFKWIPAGLMLFISAAALIGISYFSSSLLRDKAS